MSKILTPKGWRDIIVEEQTDLYERVSGFTRRVPDKEYISPADAKKEGFEDNIKFTHYAMANNEKMHFSKDYGSFEVFDFLDDRGFIRSDLKTYMIIRRILTPQPISQVLHHVQALSPVDAYNRGIHADMQRGTEATKLRLKKSVPSGVKVIRHTPGNKNVFKDVNVNKLKSKPKK